MRNITPHAVRLLHDFAEEHIVYAPSYRILVDLVDALVGKAVEEATERFNEEFVRLLAERRATWVRAAQVLSEN
jgi:hypothetical protein